jgi:signal transduction histidine kinase
VLFVVFGSILSYFAIAMAKQIIRVEESEASAILASQAKSEFLANMSHELRTPLNAIIGFSEMINSGYFGPLNAKQKERIHDINLCGSHLLQLITDILEFSKGDAGKLELVEEKVDIGEIINEGVRIMNGKVKTKAINLVVAIEPNLPFLWGDKRKIRQILINLLSNAVKFTPEHGTITITAKTDQHHNMQMIVTDTGVGIAEADIPKALSVFGQVHRSKSNEGTGLGLPLCKMYTELHDGRLILTSELGKGTDVVVVFPHQRTLVNKKEA